MEDINNYDVLSYIKNRWPSILPLAKDIMGKSLICSNLPFSFIGTQIFLILPLTESSRTCHWFILNQLLKNEHSAKFVRWSFLLIEYVRDVPNDLWLSITSVSLSPPPHSLSSAFREVILQAIELLAAVFRSYCEKFPDVWLRHSISCPSFKIKIMWADQQWALCISVTL